MQAKTIETKGKLYNFDSYLDAHYGAPGTPQREKFEEEALNSVKGLVGEEGFNKMMR